ncbi:MAG: DUF5615 family PIN-like protein [Phycisphaerales bacterium]|nr:DUF5615 family PIN-like protein [Hyphomonadaceae bacterium]
MKFLIDENLPPRIAAWLQERGFDAIHVKAAGLGGGSDASVEGLAVAQLRTIITKDGDFSKVKSVHVLQIGIGNCSTTQLLDWLSPRIADAANVTCAWTERAPTLRRQVVRPTPRRSPHSSRARARRDPQRPRRRPAWAATVQRRISSVVSVRSGTSPHKTMHALRATRTSTKPRTATPRASLRAHPSSA